MEISNRQLEIIRSASSILTELGVHGLTTKNLAAKVGFSEAAIYRHFKGKDAILIALLSYLASNMETRLSSIDPFLEPKDAIKAIFSSQASFFQANPHYVVAVFSEGLMAENNIINAKILEIMQVKRSHLLPIIEAGQKLEVFNNQLSSTAIVNIIMGTFRLQMFNWKVNNFKTNIIDKTEQTINELLTIIKTK